MSDSTGGMEDILKKASADPLSYPLWCLVDKKIFDKTGGLQSALPYAKTKDGETFAPIFDDKDLAQRMIEENTWTDCEPTPLEDILAFIAILRFYKAGGIKYVGTNFSSRQFGQPDKYGQLRTLAIFLKECEDGLSK